MSKSADILIVGGGTAGCVLASRLTEDPQISVLVLEAGPYHRGMMVSMPAGFAGLYERGQLHWDYQSAPEPFADSRLQKYKMGRVLGGSSAINGLVWVRGNRLDYDGWAASGCTGWSYADIEPYFKSFERREGPNRESSGKACGIQLTVPRSRANRLNNAFLEAAAEAGYPINPNYNGAEQEGFVTFQQNIHQGRRSDVYDAYIDPIKGRPNLRILTGHSVGRILFEGNKAVGVEVHNPAGVERYYAKAQVILCAGAIASPQLLELSGVGRPDILQAAGIQLLRALPGVGENLHTHPYASLKFKCNGPHSIVSSTRGIGKLAAGLQWLLKKTGPAASNQFEAGAFLRASPASDRPDYQVTFLPLLTSDAANVLPCHGYQIYVELINPKSRGESHIVTDKIADQPRFLFNFFQNERDLQVFEEGVRTVRQVAAQSALASLTIGELDPGPEVASSEDIRNWVRQTSLSTHHLAGTCKMGPAEEQRSVVDSSLRVHGLESLRIVDASIMPTVVSGNTHAAVIAIAEKAADLLSRDGVCRP